MAGLLDSLYANDGNNPMSMGLLGMGAGLLAGANGNYGAFGPALASGMMGAAQGMQNAREFELQNAYRQAQIGKLEQDAAKQRGIQSLLSSRFGGAPSGQGAAQAAGTLGAGAGAGAFPLSLQDVTMLKAMGGPDLLDQLKYANDGSKREAGAAYRNPVTGAIEYGPPKISEGMELVPGPNGLSVRAIPGYSAANAGAEGARAGAIAAAQLPYNIAQNRDQQNTAAGLDLVDVDDGVGGKIRMTRDQAAHYLRNRAAPGAVGTQLGGFPDAVPPGGGLGYTPSQATQEARNQFGEMNASADQLLSGIKALREHQGFDSNYGLAGLIYNRPGGPAADAKALTDQLISQGWIQMRDKLRGTGTITDYESKKAEQAWSTLNDPRISPKMAREQLGIIEEIVRDSVKRAQVKAFGTKPSDGNSASGERPGADFASGNFSSLWGG